MLFDSYELEIYFWLFNETTRVRFKIKSQSFTLKEQKQTHGVMQIAFVNKQKNTRFQYQPLYVNFKVISILRKPRQNICTQFIDVLNIPLDDHNDGWSNFCFITLVNHCIFENHLLVHTVHWNKCYAENVIL